MILNIVNDSLQFGSFSNVSYGIQDEEVAIVTDIRSLGNCLTIQTVFAIPSEKPSEELFSLILFKEFRRFIDGNFL